jgi:HlyD family secretion protein
VRQAELETLKADLRAELEKAQREAERLTAECALIDAGPRQEEILRAKAQVHVAEAEAQLGSEDAKRYANPQGLSSGAWSEAQRDHAVHQSEALQGKLELARAQLQDLEAGARPEEKQKAHAARAAAQAEVARIGQTQASRVAAGEAQLAAATAQLSTAQVALGKTRLLSPVNGSVVWKFLHAGETVDALQRQPVVAVGDGSSLQIRAYVDEADFPRVESGQTAVITADAYPARQFHGRVLRINTCAGEKPFNTGEVRERIDVKVIETILVPTENWPLKLGLRVTVRFDAPPLPR